MTLNYWAVAFYERQDSYLWIGWDHTVKESELPESLGFRMVLFETRAKARAWAKALNERHYYWSQRRNYVVVKRIRVTVAPPPRINGKLV